MVYSDNQAAATWAEGPQGAGEDGGEAAGGDVGRADGAGAKGKGK